MSTIAPSAPADPTGVPLPQQPMHDSGPLFVPRPPRALGEEVELRVWVPHSWPVSAVALRTIVDGEISTAVLAAEQPHAAPPGGTWFAVTTTVVNPVQPYRFCLVGDPEASAGVPRYAWLTAAGIVPWDVADATDFRLVAHEPAPDWVDDAVVYQVFPDRFARSAASPTDEHGRFAPDQLPDWARPMAWDEPPSLDGMVNGQQLYGGDLDGVIEHLDHIQELGADVVYLTPVFPAGSAHRYDASTFDRVDPLLGGDEALVRLSRALHERGMRLMVDLTTNHTGDTHEWFRTAQADAGSTEAGFYRFHEHPADYRCWIGVPTLPSLEHSSPELRERLLSGPDSVVGRYLRAPFLADGWRIDVANMTGRNGAEDLTHEVARTIRATMREVREHTGRDTWLLAEHGHDASGDLAGDGWHGTMNYTGFTRPLWAWLCPEGSPLNWLGLPMTAPRIPGWAAARTLRDYNAHLPWPSRLHSQNQLSSHDTPRTRTVVGDHQAHLVAITALAALPGVPTVFAGDELGLQGLTGEHSRTPMPWEAVDRVRRGEPVQPSTVVEEQIDPGIWPVLRELLALRRRHPALRRGGIQWLHMGEDSLVLLRTHPAGDILVHLARAAHGRVEIDLAHLPPTEAPEALAAIGGARASAAGQVLALEAESPGATITLLSRSAATIPGPDGPAPTAPVQEETP